jgi:hypothetical protein
VVVLLLDLAEAGQDLVHVVGLVGVGHGVLEVLELVVELAQPAASGNGLVEHGAARHLFHVLPEVPDRQLLGDGHLTLVGAFLARDHAEEGGLARSVRTHEADLLAGVELEGGLDEQDLPAVLLADAREGDHENQRA